MGAHLALAQGATLANANTFERCQAPRKVAVRRDTRPKANSEEQKKSEAQPTTFQWLVLGQRPGLNLPTCTKCSTTLICRATLLHLNETSDVLYPLFLADALQAQS